MRFEVRVVKTAVLLLTTMVLILPHFGCKYEWDGHDDTNSGRHNSQQDYMDNEAEDSSRGAEIKLHRH